MIKLIASDLDGTLLLGGAQRLEPETASLIRDLVDRGILFVAASGRQHANLRRLFAPVADDIAYICENGCISFYRDERLHKDTMERSLGQEIIRSIWEKESAEVLISGEETSYIKPKSDRYLHLIRDVVKNNVTVISDLYTTPEVYTKISVFEETGIDASIDEWKGRFGDRVNVATSGMEWLDMMPLGTDKGSALRVIMERFGIAPDETMVFGDNYNDIEMLQEAGISYVMSHAQSDVKRYGTNETDRVESVLRTLL